MHHQHLYRIGVLIERHISRRYPFHDIGEAVATFLDFMPVEHQAAYEEYRIDFIEPFLRAYIRSRLERQPRKALRSIAPVITRNTLSDIRVALMNNDYPLRRDDRDIFMNLIQSGRREFEEMIEDIVMTQVATKMLCISILSLTRKVKARDWYPETWNQ